MVCAILAQVIFRYLLGNALAWSEEGARFLMLWMTGLIAPSAYRWGGFVAIDMVPRALPRITGLVLNLSLLFVAAVVLAISIRIGWNDMTGFGGRFASPSLKVPLSLIGGEDIAFRRAWMMGALVVGSVMMFLVNIELILRNLVALLDPEREPPMDRAMISAGAD
ncbi:TRAP transporter small permease subunit [Halovulum dunhuangense]|uniref:TRAP transporter small permease protein n=2 Tax=Halovulum dunhuangense TaxID=1505036 RepID=A0A849L430_9RHOB|nr:TRAP transporter small permease subunit [Halovulum dunhuangense]